MADLLEYPEGGAFTGVIARTGAESTPAWPAPRRARPGSPNVVFIVLDDVGYGQLGCYGSDIATPNLDRLADGGLRFRNFHTTAMCSPTRACLLTGRNPHTNGLGVISELARGYPGYNGQVPRSSGFLSEMLLPKGYATLAVGKWHLAPADELHQGARRDRWPLGRGFERYYGFLGAETNHWEPDLASDNHLLRTPREDGYHLTEDLADHAIQFVRDLRSSSPTKPFFLYFALGAAHAPHHVPLEWADRYAGQFDAGWDAWREQVHARQLELGLLPPGTELAERPPWIPAWDSLSADERRLYARMMEVYAGYLTHADHHIGRVLDELEALGDLDNTIVVAISDNGASAEGGVAGSVNENLIFNGLTSPLEENLAQIDELGTPTTYNHYPFGWAWAGNTPFRRWKRETHEGGIADPMIVHWPAGIGRPGEVRHQYTHTIDVLPTLLELLGMEAPEVIDGVPQSPIAGTSFAATLTDGGAPEHRTTQHYEQFGCRAIYHDGWKAVTYHAFLGAMYDGVSDPFASFDDDRWELYHVAEDPTECHDLAEAEPERLRAMIDLWWAQAGRYDVLPISAIPGLIDPRPSLEPPRDTFVYLPFAGAIPSDIAVNVKGRPHAVVASVVIPEEGCEGVLLAHGGRFGGYALYIKDGRLHYAHRHVKNRLYLVTSDVEVPAGEHTLGMSFAVPGTLQGDVELLIDGSVVGSGHIPETVPFQYSLTGEGLCCGFDDGSAAGDYVAPFDFTGTLHRVVVSVSGEPYVDAAKAVEAAFRVQ